jgi:polyribonucleotide nucleotidyltransferase
MLSVIESENKRKLEIGDSDDFGLEKKRQTLAPTPALESLTITMDCPAASVGAIIGKKGANVHEIMKRSSCKIVIDQSDQRDGAPKRVNLTGPPDKLAIGMALVSLIIKDGANALIGGQDTDDTGAPRAIPLQSESRCPKSKVGEVIGQRGVTIAEIMRRTGCRIHIIQDPPSDGNVLEREVIYSGSEEQMNEAKVLVQSIINEGASILGIIAGSSSNGGQGAAYTPT